MIDTRRILVVDDERKQLDILKAILGREGFDVDTAATAEAAVAILHDAPPAVILTDLKLPGMDGIGLLEETLRVSPQTVVKVNGRPATLAQIKRRFQATTLRLDGGAATLVRANRVGG